MLARSNWFGSRLELLPRLAIDAHLLETTPTESARWCSLYAKKLTIYLYNSVDSRNANRPGMSATTKATKT
jgi:hypothetical protein